MTIKRSSILAEGLRPRGSSHPLSLTRPLWLKKNRIGRVCARLVNFLISSFACAKKEKIEKSKNKSHEVSSETHPAWKLSKTISRKQGRYNPRKICFPQLHELPLNFPYLKKFEKKERPPQAGSCYKMFDICPRGQLHRDESFDFRLTRS